MAAPRGNQFWKIRSKHGRDRLFLSPEELWKAACEYFEWVDKHPWHKADFKGKNVVRVNIPTERPYTLMGLCLYLGCNADYFNQFESRLTDSGVDKDFSGVITRIRETIYTQKFEGAAVGAFNANIIARDLGLIDKKDVQSGGKPLGEDIDLSEFTEEELAAYLELRLKAMKSKAGNGR